MHESIVISAIVLAAGFIQGLTGFGFVLIALPLLDTLLPLKTSIPMLCLLAFCVSLTLSIQLRKNICFRCIALFFAATVPAIPVGVFILKHVSSETLAITLGLLMIAFAASLLLYTPAPRPLGRGWTVLAGFLSGISCGCIGVGGPPMIIYFSLLPWEKDKTKGTIAFYFLISGAAVILLQVTSGLITSAVTHLFAVSLLPLFIGFLLGMFAYSRLSDIGYRKLTYTLVLGLGCMMFFNNI